MNSPRSIGFVSTLIVAAGLLLFAAPQPVSADASQGCYDQGGHCIYNSSDAQVITVCNGNETEIPANNCTGGICCKQGGPGTGCASKGGMCTPTNCQGDDVSTGYQDCGLTGGVADVCCVPAPKPEATPTDTAAPSNAPPAIGGGLELVPCTKTGDCSLDNIVTQGVNFASFIMKLSAALFFVAFIYGGGRYLLSFGRKSWVEAGTKAMTGAAIGMVLVLGAWTIVRTLVQSITGKEQLGVTPTGGSCESQGEGYACTQLTGDTADAAMTDAQQKNLTCVTGLCPGGNNVICCKKNE